MSNSLRLSAGRPSEHKKAAALKAIAEEPLRKVRVNFELDETAHLKLKVYAAKSRRSISDVLRELINEHIPNS